MSLFSMFNRSESSGIFIPKGDAFVELVDDFEDKSINGIGRHLGYHPDQVHTVFSDEKDNRGIEFLVVEVFTKNVVFVQTNSKVLKVRKRTVDKLIENLNTEFYFGATGAATILQNGVISGSLTSAFLSEVLGFQMIYDDGIAYAERLGMNLFFIDGVLVDYQSADGLNEYAKKIRDLNPDFFNKYEKQAKRYWGNNLPQVINEINTQFAGWAGVPHFVNNEHIPLHTDSSGVVNFAMILVCHYGRPLTRSQFETINHGRFRNVAENVFVCGKFLYSFNVLGDLISATQIS